MEEWSSTQRRCTEARRRERRSPGRSAQAEVYQCQTGELGQKLGQEESAVWDPGGGCHARRRKEGCAIPSATEEEDGSKEEDPQVVKWMDESEGRRTRTELYVSHPLLYILVRQAGRQIPAMIDTGATVNLYNNRKLSTPMKVAPLFEQVQDLVGAAGSKVGIAKYGVAMVTFPNRRTSAVVVCEHAECPLPLILGAPWLKQVKASLDYKVGRLTTRLGTFAWDPGKRLGRTRAVYMCEAVSREGDTEVSIGEVKAVLEGLTTEERETVQKAVESCVLTERGKQEVRRLLVLYKDVWTGSAIGCAKGTEHRIEVTVNRPVAVRMRAIPQKWQKALDDHIQELLKEGVLERSESDCAAVPVCVGKPDGSLRLCVDYRKLNTITVPDRFPLPLIQDLIQSTAGSRYFILIDLRAGFWQIPLEKSSRKWTAFRTHKGLYQWTVMPFGLIHRRRFNGGRRRHSRT